MKLYAPASIRLIATSRREEIVQTGKSMKSKSRPVKKTMSLPQERGVETVTATMQTGRRKKSLLASENLHSQGEDVDNSVTLMKISPFW